MSLVHSNYTEWKNINHQIKDLELKLKSLRVLEKKKKEELYKSMEAANLDSYYDLKKEAIKPKEKKKPLTSKKKSEALVKYFAKMGIENPEKLVKEMREVEKNARETS